MTPIVLEIEGEPVMAQPKGDGRWVASDSVYVTICGEPTKLKVALRIETLP